jgi:protein SCO1
MRSFALIAVLGLASTAVAAPLPPIDRVAFAPSTRAALPLDARFVDEDGRPVRLGDVLRRRPAIVVPAYFGCSNLCTLVLRGVAASLARSGLRAGTDVDVVAISIAPLETPALAAEKKRELFASSEDGVGWHFLTGQDAQIARVADALGYRYAYVPAERQYAHASGIAVVSPGGRIARVLYGVTFATADLQRAVAVRDETIASTPRPPVHHPGAATVDDAPVNWLLCFHYDPRVGRYTFVAMNAVRVAGLLSLAGLAAFAWRASRRERRTPARR